MSRRPAIVQIVVALALALVSFLALRDAEGVTLSQTLRIFFSAFASGAALTYGVLGLSRKEEAVPE